MDWFTRTLHVHKHMQVQTHYSPLVHTYSVEVSNYSTLQCTWENSYSEDTAKSTLRQTTAFPGCSCKVCVHQRVCGTQRGKVLPLQMCLCEAPLPLASLYSITSLGRVWYSNRWIGKAYSSDKKKKKSDIILVGPVKQTLVLFLCCVVRPAATPPTFTSLKSFCSPPQRDGSWNGY